MISAEQLSKADNLEAPVVPDSGLVLAVNKFLILNPSLDIPREMQHDNGITIGRCIGCYNKGDRLVLVRKKYNGSSLTTPTLIFAEYALGEREEIENHEHIHCIPTLSQLFIAAYDSDQRLVTNFSDQMPDYVNANLFFNGTIWISPETRQNIQESCTIASRL